MGRGALKNKLNLEGKGRVKKIFFPKSVFLSVYKTRMKEIVTRRFLVQQHRPGLIAVGSWLLVGCSWKNALKNAFFTLVLPRGVSECATTPHYYSVTVLWHSSSLTILSNMLVFVGTCLLVSVAALQLLEYSIPELELTNFWTLHILLNYTIFSYILWL